MINLRLKAEFKEKGVPFVARLQTKIDQFEDADPEKVVIYKDEVGYLDCESSFGPFKIFKDQQDDFLGDLIIVHPNLNKIQRLFRANSKNNTFLFTERCDQLCAMCSQPPREIDDTWRHPLYYQAIELLPKDTFIFISGGEPTLYKESLFNILSHAAEIRPDIRFQILSNGQHFEEEDVERLREIHEKLDVTWGVPLYSSQPDEHELIVGKKGSFNPLMKNLFLLASSGAKIELRTVVTKVNVLGLAELGMFISDHIPFISCWAIMAMEPIGFAKANKEGLYYDHSIAPQPIHNALDVAKIRGIFTRLFNFPTCTIGEEYHDYAVQSISDWKNKYIEECDSCSKKDTCCGFFEWYTDEWKWENVRALR